MFRSSPPTSDEEATDDEMPLLQEHQDNPSPSDNIHPPPTSCATPAPPLPSGMDCFHSITDPLRAYFSTNAPRKPRSKSHGDAERPPRLRTRSWRQSVDLPRNPPPTPRTSEDPLVHSSEQRQWMQCRDLKEVIERQQAEYLRVTASKHDDPPRYGQQEGALKRPVNEGQRSEPADIGTTGLKQLEGPERRYAVEAHDEFMERLLAPVVSALYRLKSTKIPPYNPRLNVKSASQVSRDRLLPIGKHISGLLQRETVEKRGEREVEICRYIAEKYWPNDVVEKDYLGIMEMYRNAVFLENLNKAGQSGSEEMEVLKGG